MNIKVDQNLMSQILKNESIGIWVMELEQGKEPRLYIDESMRRTLGMSVDFTPEEVFRFWYDNIHSDDSEGVLEVIEQMKQGQAAEVTFVWKHPWLGLLNARCSGVLNSDSSTDRLFRFEGCYRDVTRLFQVQKKSELLSQKMSKMIVEDHEQEMIIESLNKVFFAVHHFNMVSAEFHTLRLQEGITDLIANAHNMYEAVDVFCNQCVMPESKDRMHLFMELSSMRKRFGDEDVMTEDYLSKLEGWVKVYLIVAERDNDGEITDVIFAARRINKEKTETMIADNMLRALSSDYHSVYRINADKDEAISYRMSNVITKQFGNRFAVSRYSDSFLAYKEQVVIEEDWPLFEQLDDGEKLNKFMEGRTDYMFPYRVKRDGRVQHCIGRIVRVQGSESEYVFGFKGNDEIVEEHKEQDRKLREALQKEEAAKDELKMAMEEKAKMLNLAYESLQCGTWEIRFGEDGGYEKISWSEELQRLLGFGMGDEFMKRLGQWEDFVHPEDWEKLKKEYYDVMDDYSGGKSLDVEYRLKTADGEWKWFRTTGRLARREDGSPRSYAGFMIDINDRVYHEDRESRLEKEALTDSLTGLANRRAYDYKIDKIGEQESIENISIVAFDVNGLKTANDTLGHAAGDELLKGAAECIQKTFGPIGSCYRIGGDEFMVIIERPLDNYAVLFDAFYDCQEKWEGKLAKSLSVSFGIVRAKDQPFVPLKRLIQMADDDMYANKKKMYYDKMKA